MVKLWYEEVNNKVLVKSNNPDFPIVKTFPYVKNKIHPDTYKMREVLVKICAFTEEKAKDFIITEKEMAIEEALAFIVDFNERMGEIESR